MRGILQALTSIDLHPQEDDKIKNESACKMHRFLKGQVLSDVAPLRTVTFNRFSSEDSGFSQGFSKTGAFWITDFEVWPKDAKLKLSELRNVLYLVCFGFECPMCILEPSSLRLLCIPDLHCTMY